MGIFGKLFGGGKEYPAIDPASTEAQIIEKFRPQFESLVKKVDDKYEAVPSQNALYIFLGNPPGMFGMVWFMGGDAEEHNLKKMMSKKGLSQKMINLITERLREAYKENESKPRFSAAISGKQVTVTPSDSFADRLYTILHVMEE